MQLTLTDQEAELLECRLSNRRRSYSNSETLILQSIADRLLAREVGSVSPYDKDWAFVPTPYDDQPATEIVMCWPRATPIRVKGTIEPHNIRRETDEYACSCGARWDVTDGEVHP